MKINEEINIYTEEIKNIEQEMIKIDNEIKATTNIDLKGKQVIHLKYGKGNIIEQNNETIKINFGKYGEKTFNTAFVFIKKSLDFSDDKIQIIFKTITDLINKKMEFEKDKKVKEIELERLIKLQCQDNAKIVEKSNQLVNRICSVILDNLKNGNNFDVKETKYSCIQISKRDWLNDETKGLHYEVWCKNIETKDLYGSRNANVVIAFHIEGRNPNIENIVNKMAMRGIYRNYRGYIVEEENITLNFYNEEEIEKSIKIIAKEISKLDEKYTTIIDEVIEEEKKE